MELNPKSKISRKSLEKKSMNFSINFFQKKLIILYKSEIIQGP